MTDIQEIIDTLAFIGTESENPALQEFIEQHDVALPLAFAVKYEFAILTPRGAESLQKTYDFLNQIKEERGLETVSDLAYTEQPIPRTTFTVTI